ncbi:hypothetical protein SteCoe_5216 [Stentor coeruleus]|uniref:Uncharacterized protein n=1 Tax=Stentor coeruleus TaxID=5963 RepID=A0A1R2CSY6_9CILI|nr:hypothetical protein SteCoe_5216 [Stentor coeruleus]
MKISLRTSPRSRVVYTSQDSQKLSISSSSWEILERIESCELRFKTSQDSSIDKMTYWKNCYSDILPIIQKDNPGLSSNITRLIKGIFCTYDSTQETWVQKFHQKVDEIQTLSEKIKSLNLVINKLKEDLTNSEQIKLNEEMRIKGEVENMFGTDENEIKEIRQRCKKLMDSKPTGVVSMLKEIYMNMVETRLAPDMQESYIESPDPEDIAYEFKKNYNIILKSATKNALNILKKDVKMEVKSSQTHIPFMTEEQFEELVGKFEKNNIALQSALMQIDQLRQDLSIKNANAERLEGEKNHAFLEMLNAKRDAENANKELLGLKKDLHLVSAEKIKTSYALEVKTREVLKQDEKIQSQAVKIKKLSQSPRKHDSDISSANDNALNPKSEDFLSEESERNERQYLYNNVPIENYRRKSIQFDGKKPVFGLNAETASLEPQKALSKRYPASISSFNSSSSLSQSNDINQDEVNNFPEIKGKTKAHLIYRELARAPTKSSSIKDEYREYSPEKTFDRSPETLETLEYAERNKGMNNINKKQTPDKNTSKKPSPIKKNMIIKKDSIEESPKSAEKKTPVKRESYRKGSKKLNLFNEENTKSIGLGTKGDYEAYESCDEEGKKRQFIRDGKIIELIDRANNTILTMQLGTSVAIQYNSEQIEDSETKTRSLSSHMMPFNPNNFYGLKGDVFYNSSCKVFGAQSRNSEFVKNYNYIIEKSK